MIFLKKKLKTVLGEKEFQKLDAWIETRLLYGYNDKRPRRKLYYELFLNMYTKGRLSNSVDDIVSLKYSDQFSADYHLSQEKDTLFKYRPKLSETIASFPFTEDGITISQDLDSIVKALEIGVVRREKLSKRKLKRLSKFMDHLKEAVKAKKVFPEELIFQRFYTAYDKFFNGYPSEISEEISFLKENNLLDDLKKIDSENLYYGTIALVRASIKDTFFSTKMFSKAYEINLKRLLGDSFDERLVNIIKDNPTLPNSTKLHRYFLNYLALKHLIKYDKEMIDVELFNNINSNTLSPNSKVVIDFFDKSGIYKEILLLSNNIATNEFATYIYSLSNYVTKVMKKLDKSVKFEKTSDFFRSLKHFVEPMYLAVRLTSFNEPLVGSLLNELKDHLSTKYKVDDDALLKYINTKKSEEYPSIELDEDIKNIIDKYSDVLEGRISSFIAEYLVNLYSNVNKKSIEEKDDKEMDEEQTNNGNGIYDMFI